MKNLLLLLTILPLFSTAQYMDLKNGKWYFSNTRNSPFANDPVPHYRPAHNQLEVIEWVKDTMINNFEGQILSNGQILRYSNDSLFSFQNSTQAFELIFDFNSQVGDTIDVFVHYWTSDTIIHDYFKAAVNSHKTVTMDSVSLKMFCYTIVDSFYLEPICITEKIGHEWNGITDNEVYVGASTIPEGPDIQLKCYIDNDIYINRSPIPCDSITPDTIFTNINELKTNRLLKVYPNPSNGQLFIENVEQKPLHFNIFDLQGRSVYSGQYQGNGIVLPNHLRNGIYLLQLEHSAGIHRQKFVLQR